MTKQALKFNDFIVNKQTVALSLVDTDKMVISDKYNPVIMILNTLLAI